MNRNEQEYMDCVHILEEELIPAMGCTEPVAISYAAALARETLGQMPEQVTVICSGNIIKNVKSVIVPNTGGMHGIAAAAGAGIAVGDASKKLEVIASVTESEVPKIAAFLEAVPIQVKLSDSGLVFDIRVELKAGEESTVVRIADHHTNVVLIEKNGETLFSQEVDSRLAEDMTDRNFLNMQTIFDFAESVAIDDVRKILDRQISYNMAIAGEGMKNPYGANVGKVIAAVNPESPKSKAVAWAAAGSDARMSGCEMAVVINSGSGNQGITASVPVIVYAREKGYDEEKLYRALVLSNLIAIYQKNGIGRLSAFCGAVNAGAGAGCGIAYLDTGSYDAVIHTLVNCLAIVSGIICDGAKPSCAGKIASAVEAGFLGYEMYLHGQQFYGGDGIVKRGVDKTVNSVSILGREGMRQTDEMILKIMMDL